MATALEKAIAAIEKRKIVSFEDYQAWLAARRMGITATEVKLLYKDAGGERELAQLIKDKREGKTVDLSGNQYVQRGNEREPVIAAWIERKFGIAPNDFLMRCADTEGHIATPDGLLVYAEKVGRKTVIRPTGSEIKTSKNDLTPGPIEDGWLVDVEGARTDPAYRTYWLTGYYEQKQWQIHILGDDCEKILFAWEQHDNNWPNPQPLEMEPSWCWVRRDQAVIDKLVAEADRALAVLHSADREADEAEQEQLVELLDNDVSDSIALGAMIADLTAQRAVIDQRIKDALADKTSASVATDRWKLSYFTPNGRATFNKDALAKEQPDIYKQYYTPGAPGAGTPVLKLAPITADDTAETGETE